MKRNFLPMIAMLSLAACSNQPTPNNMGVPQTDSFATEVTAEPAPSETTFERDLPEESEREEDRFIPKHRTNCSDEYERLKNNSWKVDGKVSAKNFIKALYQGTDYAVQYPEDVKEMMDEEDFFVCDEKNGYASHFSEGAGCYRFVCCYWKRTDGKITVGLYSHDHDCISETEYDCSAYLLFYAYNPDSHMLEPIQQPFQLEIGNPNHLLCMLPKQGTDILLDLCERNTCNPGEDFNYLLKWNGKNFDVVKQSVTDDLASWTNEMSAADREIVGKDFFTWPASIIRNDEWGCSEEALADDIRDLVFSTPLLITADELTQYKRVRKTIVERNESYRYDYFKCAFSWEVNNMTLCKNSGSQRLVGIINRIDERLLSFTGCWYAADEQPQGYGNNDHSVVGYIKKVGKDKIIMLVPEKNGMEIHEFAK